MAIIDKPIATYLTPSISENSKPYNKIHGEVINTLYIDARSGHVYIHLQSYDRDTNRTKDIAINLTKSSWDEYVKVLKESGYGEI